VRPPSGIGTCGPTGSILKGKSVLIFVCGVFSGLVTILFLLAALGCTFLAGIASVIFFIFYEDE
jgi:hypothetical protein